MSTSIKTGHQIRALDVNQTRTHAVLAGRKILKTIRLGDEPSCTEEFNLRTAAVSHARDSPPAQQWGARRKSGVDSPDPVSSQRDLFDIEDVAWSNNEFSDYIATAARNGRVILYNLNRPGVEVGSLQEHYRQVHKVDFNPSEGACLLSGSQDGTVRLWDLRSLRRNLMASASMNTFSGRSEGVRHVKWSSRDTWAFAFCTDNGTIQRWDTRSNRAPLLKISAHYETCNSIDWHPDGKHLVSAGKDQVAKVWDLSPETRTGKYIFAVRTPREIQNVRWRLPCFTIDAADQNVKQCTHFATAYRHYPVVHVWDIRRPFIPFREIHHQTNTGTADMLWRTKDLLWTVGPEGEFNQTDMTFAPKTVDRRPMCAASCAPDGELNFVSRRRGRRPGLYRDQRGSRESTDHNYRQSESPDWLTFGRSPGDDAIDETFLDVPTGMMHSRTPSTKSAKLLGSTPPSTDELARMEICDLRSAVETPEFIRPVQTGKLGSTPGVAHTDVFRYLAQKYQKPPSKLDMSYMQNCQAIYQQHAAQAELASIYRDAQTWKILGHQVSKEVGQRAEANRKLRLDAKRLEVSNPKERHELLVKTRPQANTAPGSSSRVPLTAMQNTSDVPTPIARPVAVTATSKQRINQPVFDDDVKEDLHLPPSLTVEDRTISQDNGTREGNPPDRGFAGAPRPLSTRKSAASYSEQDHALNQIPSERRTPYSLDLPSSATRGVDVPPRLERNDSSEFFMFSTSSESQPRAPAHSSFESDMSRSMDRESDESPEKWRDSSFPSTESMRSAQQFSSEQGSPESGLQREFGERESFLDLPAHGNLLVDDFVEPTHSQPPLNGKIANETNGASPRGARHDSNHEISIREMQEESSSKKVGGDSHYSGVRSNGRNHTEASQEISPDLQVDQTPLRKRAPTLEAVQGASKSGLLDSRNDAADGGDTGYVFSDYVTPRDNNDDTLLQKLSAKDMFLKLLAWYTQQGDSQMASHLFLLTAPLLTPSESIHSSLESSNTSTLDRHYHDYFVSPPLSFQPEAASSILARHYLPLKALDIEPAFAESILSTYHERLLAMNVNTSATELRKLCYPAFPGVYDQGIKDNQIGTLCQSCQNPINNPFDKLHCESCRKQQAACAICCCKISPFNPQGRKTASLDENHVLNSSSNSHTTLSADEGQDEVAYRGTAMWTCCPLCNHSTHTACGMAWFADAPLAKNGGACPVAGCACNCERGPYRQQQLAKLEGERQRAKAKRGGVRKDEWIVAESNAVGRVRGALKAKETPGANGRVSSSDNGGANDDNGARSGSLEDSSSKKVRVVAPEGSGR